MNDYRRPNAFVEQLREWLRDRGAVLAWVGLFVAVVGGIGWLAYASIDDYRGQCHGQGGHIVEVKGTEVCVDRENRVIFL